MSSDPAPNNTELEAARVREAYRTTVECLTRLAVEYRGVDPAEALTLAVAAVADWPAARLLHFWWRRQLRGQAITHRWVMDHTGQTKRELQYDCEEFADLSAELPSGVRVSLLTPQNYTYGVLGGVLWIDGDPPLATDLVEKQIGSTERGIKRALQNGWALISHWLYGRQLAKREQSRRVKKARRIANEQAQLSLDVLGKTGTGGE